MSVHSLQLVEKNDLSSSKMSWAHPCKRKCNVTLLPCRILNPIYTRKQREINYCTPKL